LAEYKIVTPVTEDDLAAWKAGDKVLITGFLFAARDAAHKRFADLISAGRPLPIDIKGHFIYYVGPTPPPPGRPIGSAGPTTSGRMDPFTPALLERGLKGTIGKGERSEDVKKAMVRTKSVYLAAVGGAGALLARHIESSEVVAYAELGPEAVRGLKVRNLPCVVINDIYGGDLYRDGRTRYRRG
jgi:fumarate hydratase subunit beta